MRRRELGRTGLRVSELGLGGLFLSGTPDGVATARAVVDLALSRGVNLIDTAPSYGDSERVLGEVLAGETRPVVLSTKVGAADAPDRARDPRFLRESVERSLRRLRRDCVDLLLIHEPDRPGQVPWWDGDEPLSGPVLEVLADLREAGVIRFTGLGGTTAYRLAELCATGLFDVVLTAFNYSILWREAELHLLPAAAEAGMGIIVGTPFQQGALARRWDAELAGGAPWLSPPRRAQLLDLYRCLDDARIPVHEAALRFVLSNPVVSCVVAGARSPQEMAANIDAIEAGPLDDSLLDELARIAARVPFRPFDEPPILPFGRPFTGPGAMV